MSMQLYNDRKNYVLYQLYQLLRAGDEGVRRENRVPEAAVLSLARPVSAAITITTHHDATYLTTCAVDGADSTQLSNSDKVAADHQQSSKRREHH